MATATGTGYAEGGGLYDEDGLGLINCTISGNTASAASGNGLGGAICTFSEPLTMQNCTLFGNTATATTGSGQGGGIYIGSSANVTVQSCTIAGNSAAGAGANTGGGGLFTNDASPVNLANSIFATNTTTGVGPDARSTAGHPITTSDHDLFGVLDANATITSSNGDLSGTAAAPLNPKLSPLAYNGGFSTVGAPGSFVPLQTMAEQAGSPALAAGNVTTAGVLPFDQRGTPFLRIVNGAVDIGAFQQQPFATTVTLTATPNPVNFGQPLTLTATVTAPTAGGSVPTGSVNFFDESTPIGTGTLNSSGVATITVSSLPAGSHSLTAVYVPTGNFSASTSPAITQVVNGSPLPPPDYIAIGADTGAAPQVTVYNSFTNGVVSAFYAFTPTFSGGVRVAVDDINGDDVPDIIAAAGPGGGPQVVVIDGTKLNQIQSNGQIANAALITSFYAFNAPTFTGGVFVAAGTAPAGQNWLVVGADAGGGPQVTVYTAKALTTAGTTGAAPVALANFYAFASTFTGGVRVALATQTDDNIPNILCAAGPGTSPEVRIFDGLTFQLLGDAFAFAQSFSGGVYVATGDVNGDGFTDFIIGAGPGGGPEVRILDGHSITLLGQFFAYPQSFTGGVRVGFDPAFGLNRTRAILTMAGPGGSPELNVFDAVTQKSLVAAFFLPASFTGGAFVAG